MEKRYTLAQKIEVLKHLQACGNASLTARTFGVSMLSVRDWAAAAVNGKLTATVKGPPGELATALKAVDLDALLPKKPKAVDLDLDGVVVDAPKKKGTK